MIFPRLFGAAAAALLLPALLSPSAARADSEAQLMVDRSTAALKSMVGNPDQAAMAGLLRDAAGVIIIPRMLKGAFFFGAEGGSGVLVARDSAGGWSYPAFYTAGSGSFGLQFGAEASEVIYILRSPGALDAVLKNQVKLGADVSAALGPIGVGREAAATTNVGADIVAFASSQGLFAGGSVEGTVIARRNDWNGSYYGKGAEPGDIISGKFRNPGAEGLRQALRDAVKNADGRGGAASSGESLPPALPATPITEEPIPPQ